MSDWIIQKNEADNASSMVQPSSISIAEMVAQTANQIVSEQFLPGYTYYEEYGMYYNSQDGYFYDPKSSLFYHPTTQCYYSFNQQTNQYEVYPTKLANGQQTSWTKKNFRKRAIALLGGEFVENAPQDEIDVMELTLDLVDKCSFLSGDYRDRPYVRKRLFQAEAAEFDEEIDGILIQRAYKNANSSQQLNYPSSSDDDEEEMMKQEIARRAQEEEIAREAPCIRVIERPVNTLHIVTILGARVGFGKGMDIQLMNGGYGNEKEDQILFTINYSNNDYSLEYEAESAVHSMVKLNSQPIMFGKFTLSHEDQITIETEVQHILLSLHIHNGLNTCQNCEPGLFKSAKIQTQLKPLKKFSKNVERRRQTRAMKEQYGLLEKDDHEMDEIRTKYIDRAKKRRKIMGSEHPNPNLKRKEPNAAGGIYSKCIAAPIPGCSTDSVQLRAIESEDVNKPKKAIEESNKGFQLLKGMGWRAGQGLGKNNQGIQGPIDTLLKNDRIGLGGMEPTEKQKPKISIHFEKHEILERTRKRYEQIQENQ